MERKRERSMAVVTGRGLHVYLIRSSSQVKEIDMNGTSRTPRNRERERSDGRAGQEWRNLEWKMQTTFAG